MDLKQGVLYTHQFLMVQDATGANPHIGGKTGLGGAVTVYLGKNGAAGGVLAGNSGAGVSEVDATHMPGVYAITFTLTDLNLLGSLSFAATAAAADPTNESHRVVTQLPSDIQLDINGNVRIASQVKINTAFLLPFIMTVNGVPTPSMTGFTAQRNLAGAGFAPCANTVVEDGSGWYHILLAPTDTNGTVIEVHITAAVTGADDRNITLYTQP